MVESIQPSWNPTFIRRVEKAFPTGTEVVAVVTVAGPGYAKFLGNKEGPHVLACEFMGSKLAALLNLPVFDHAVLNYDGIPEIKLESGRCADRGPAWITRKETGFTLGGHPDDLKLLSNPEDLAGLVVLDTWTLNCDRFCPALQPTRINRNNVFFSQRPHADGLSTLVAMDHTHILTCGRAITPALAGIDRIKSDDIYGFFPEFRKIITFPQLAASCLRLSMISDDEISAIAEKIPDEWLENPALREILTRFLIQRRDYVAAQLPTRIFPQGELPL